MHETSQYHVQVRTRKYLLYFQGQMEKLILREKWEGKAKDCPELVLDPAIVGKWLPQG